MSRGRIKGVSPAILKQCREQLGLSIEQATRLSKVPKLPAIEGEQRPPTYNQLHAIADTYLVPAWVFLREELPREYCYSSLPAFRTVGRQPLSKPDTAYKVKELSWHVESIRELFLEFHQENDDPVPPFKETNPPRLAGTKAGQLEAKAKAVRSWLGIRTEAQRNFGKESFPMWRKAIEQKHIYIFLTRKFSHWSKIDQEIRGMAIYHDTLPVIIINDSDHYRAQLFTLIHELGHLLRKETALDTGEHHKKNPLEEETFCNRLAANVLMEPRAFRASVRKYIHRPEEVAANPEILKKVAAEFGISQATAAIQMLQLGLIENSIYEKLQRRWRDETEARKKLLQESPGGPIRNVPQETLKQYGEPYLRSVYQAYYDKKLTLNKLCNLLSLSKTAHARQLGGLLDEAH